MPPTRPIARTPTEASATVNPDEALQSGDERYVPLDAARGTSKLAESLRARIVAHEQSNTFGAYARFLVTGHRGCGKTTELYRLKELLTQDHFAVVYFDVERELNLQDCNWWNILLEMVWQIDEQLSQPPFNLAIPEQLRDAATEWLARAVTEKTERRDMEASLTTEFGVSTGLPFFAKAKAAIKALVKAGSSEVKKIAIEAERRPSQLHNAVTDLIAHVRRELYEKQGRGSLVVIADGLEKIPLHRLEEGGLTTHNSLFIHNGNHLKAPPCHTVYTLPFALLNSANVGEVFPERPLLMPMVRVRNRDGKEDRRVLSLMAKVITQRVSPDIFAPGVIKRLALASGGHIRDFLLLVRDAATEFGQRITKADAERAVANLTDLYDRTLEQLFIEPLDFVAKHGVLSGGPHDGELIYRLLVLEYRDGENNRWAALHPCVKEAPRYVRSPRERKEETNT